MAATFTPPKKPAERDLYGFNFATAPLAVGETITSATFTLTVISGGVDPSPNAMKVGAPVLLAASAHQMLEGGVANVWYLLHCVALTSEGRILEECAKLLVSGCT